MLEFGPHQAIYVRPMLVLKLVPEYIITANIVLFSLKPKPDVLNFSSRSVLNPVTDAISRKYGLLSQVKF